MQKEDVFEYPYFSQTVEIYKYLESKYPANSVYFSKNLGIPSVCIEIDKRKYEFYVAENLSQNSEVWIYRNYTDLPHKTSGGGFATKLINLLDQVIEFLPKQKPEYVQQTIFDFL